MGKSKQSPGASGVYAALATPRRPDSTEADAAVLLDYLDTVVRAGVDGLVLFGSTGEFVHFDLAERMRTLALAIRRSRVPVLVNISHSTLAGAVELAENAVGAGADGLLLMPPYFYRYTDEQLLAFYREFVKTIGTTARIYLYNLPFFTNPIGANLLQRLLESGEFAGIKDSSGEWHLFEVLLALRRKVRFALMTGHESLYLETRSAGADGIISGVAAAVPELPVAMDRAIRANEMERAQRLNSRLKEFTAWVEKFPATVAIKQAAVARGWKVDHAAFSFDDATKADLAAYHQWLDNWLPRVLTECSDALAMRA